MMLAVPIRTWTGTAGPGATPAGTCALICRTPETKPGAAPSKLSWHGRPPMVTDTAALGTGSGAEATIPSTPAGVVTPAPVAKMLTQSPRAAGFDAEFTLLSRGVQDRAGALARTIHAEDAGCGGGNLQRDRIRQHAQVLQLKLRWWIFRLWNKEPLRSPARRTRRAKAPAHRQNKPARLRASWPPGGDWSR